VRTKILASSLIVLSSLLIGLTLTQTLAQTKAQPVQQLRGLWVDAFGPGFKTPQEADALVSFAKSMRLNALFLQVGRRMDCYCNRSSVPRSADPKLQPGFDALEYVVQKAHAQGIQVHAWIITTAALNLTEPAISANHVFNTHGTSSSDPWLTQQQNGTTLAGKDYVLDAGHPAAAEYIAQFYKSVVQNYDIDGIQFDRVRYPDSGDANFRSVWGYNKVALARFKTETGRSDTPAPTDPQWSQWRRDQITNLVRRVYLETKAVKPNLWVSAATIVYKTAPRTLEEFRRTRTYAEVLQDWVSWMQGGILDLNLPMNYKRETNPEQVQEFNGWARFAVTQRAKATVAIGTAIYLNTLPDSLKQLARGNNIPGVSGWVGYSYRTPDVDTFAGKKTTPAAQAQLLRAFTTAPNAPFSNDAGWGRPDTGNLSGIIGRVVKNGSGASNIQLEVSGSDGSSVSLRSDSNGYYGLPNLPVGATRVSVVASDAVSRPLEATAVLGRVVTLPDFDLGQ
jgi:uncharacterized lipoprotein YddW (UPF0748 family)